MGRQVDFNPFMLEEHLGWTPVQLGDSLLWNGIHYTEYSKSFYRLIDIQEQAAKWCEIDLITGRWSVRHFRHRWKEQHFYFKNRRDAIMFKLRWSAEIDSVYISC